MTIVQKLRTFGRNVFNLYDQHPLLMNSAVGSTVFCLGEIIAELNKEEPPTPEQAEAAALFGIEPAKSGTRLSHVDWTRVAKLGGLGLVENGVLMSWWYSFLNRVVGGGVGSATVLFKCACDQVFFATQQDGVFLALCAVQDAEDLPHAIADVKRSFVTTWLNDCSVWPLVNFVGFSVVPVKMQPTYMSAAQLFWQIYLSSVAQARDGVSAGEGSAEDRELRAVFDAIDTDHSGFLDAPELLAALRARGVAVSATDVDAMIRDADSLGDSDGKVSLAEFRAIYHGHDSLKTFRFWTSLKRPTLQKGSREIIKRLETRAETREARIAVADQKALVASTSVAVVGGVGAARVANVGTAAAAPKPVEAEPTTDEIGQGAWRPFLPPSLVVALEALLQPVDHSSDPIWQHDRESALGHCKIGGSLLLTGAIIRKLALKL